MTGVIGTRTAGRHVNLIFGGHSMLQDINLGDALNSLCHWCVNVQYDKVGTNIQPEQLVIQQEHEECQV
jgi:hypothetical protein